MTDESQRWRADRARDYLEHVRGLSLSLESRQQEIEELRSKMLPQGIVYGGMPGSPNAYGDAIPDGIAKLEALIASYRNELALLMLARMSWKRDNGRDGTYDGEDAS